MSHYNKAMETAAKQGYDVTVKTNENLENLYSEETVKVHTNEIEGCDSIHSELKDVEKYFLCGTYSFIDPNKETDPVHNKDNIRKLTLKKLQKDYDNVKKLEAKSSLDAKEQKKLTTSFSGMRGCIGLLGVIENSNDKSEFIVGTRGKAKISVASKEDNIYDIGSKVYMDIEKDNMEVINEIISKCLKAKDNQFAYITGGSNQERKDKAKAIRTKIKKLRADLKEEEILKICYHIQPISRNCEKTCLLAQRGYFMDKTVKTALIQGGNRDGLIAINDKFVVDVKVSDVDLNEVREKAKILLEV